MNVWVVSHLGESDGTRITLELLRLCGADATHVDPRNVAVALSTGRVEVAHAHGLPLPDLVYTRVGSSAPTRALDVVRQLEAAGIRCVNTPLSLERSRDKLRSYQLLAAAGLPIIETVLVGARDSLDEVVRRLGPPPYVIKLPLSSKGTGVTIADSQRALRATLDLLDGLGERVIVQRFVAHSAGTDTRVLVIGGRAVLAVRRQAGGDEFRSNVYLGGGDHPIALDERAAAIAERAAEVHGLEVAGVDMLEDRDGYVIAEVNGSPGLAGPHRRHPETLRGAFSDWVEGVRKGLR